MENSRDLNELTPRVADLARKFIVLCKAHGIDVIIISTYRDSECQQALYDKGRTTPGNIVTNAKPGQSFHNYRCAFDFCPLVNGKPSWEDEKLYTTCGSIAETLGLEWAGRWATFRELAHCQYTGGLKLADLQQGKEIA